MQDPGFLPLTVGKHLISPLTQVLHNGWVACSVSIRTGTGGDVSERVLRLTRLFRDRLAAAEYARGEGLQWVAASPRLAAF